ncbi:MAG TPA: DUF5715 family protein [Pyrinomonadaceae bacterium]|nr:DUF5715 family protein [Pyrinomonadaceae bacterium]
MRVSLHITSGHQSRTVELGDELTIGRTPDAHLVLDDAGLSRVNTTIFREGDEVLVVDENSTNGTFLNGERISGRPRLLKNGDHLKIGSHTDIRVDTEDGGPAEAERPPAAAPRIEPALPHPLQRSPDTPPPNDEKFPMMLVAAIAMTLLILIFGGLAFLIATRSGNGGPTPTPREGARIPVRVIDPLGGEDEDDLDDLIASWETEEEELKIENVADINVTSGIEEEASLTVTAAFLAEQKRKAFEDRPGEKGIRPAGLNVPRELLGDGVIKQKQKLREMNAKGYQQPMDFADLADKRLGRQLIEMPMATNSFYLEVGGSASDGPFTSFSFPNNITELKVGDPKYGTLSRLAADFSGQRYDLNNPADRKQMRMRLLRMFHPNARPILIEIANAYYERFRRPLRVTSLTRSMDYQILLNANNPNSFRVRGEGSLPPHTSGCAFDLARKHMPVDEQNFVMAKLAEMERDGKLDALIEYGANACFHVFIYDDGVPPKM